MKVIGIEIMKKRAICFALEKDNQGNYINLSGKFKYLEIQDDQDNGEIMDFKYKIHAFFNNINSDAIAIITRQTKGKFSSSPFSFKLEGLIQCYDKIDIEFIAPKTLATFYKRNPMTVPYDNNYQENAARLSNYLLNR